MAMLLPTSTDISLIETLCLVPDQGGGEEGEAKDDRLCLFLDYEEETHEVGAHGAEMFSAALLSVSARSRPF